MYTLYTIYYIYILYTIYHIYIYIYNIYILVDTKLNFSQNLTSITAKAHACCCLIFKCFLSKNSVVVYCAFVVYVTPLLEYGSCSWPPSCISCTKRVEAVQRKFTKKVQRMSNLDYKERLTRLDAETLELRRLNIDLITVYKILFIITDIDLYVYFAF